MAELKPGWQRVKFGDVVRQVKDKVDPHTSGLTRYVAGEHMETDELRIRRWGDVGDGYLGPAFHMHFKPGQVLYGSRRTYLRKVALADFEGICANTTFVLESADSSSLLPELLPFVMQTESFHEHSQRESKGSVNPYVNFSDLAWYEFALPPLEEQLRITSALKAIDHARQCAREATEALQDVRLRSYIDCTTKGIRGERERRMTESPLGLIPANWKCVELGKAARILNRLRKPISSSERSKIPGPYPYHGPTGILDRISEYRLEGEYVLLGEDGDHFLKWRSWSMTQLTKGRFNVNNHAHILEGTTDCRTRWIYHFFRHRSIHEWLTKQGAGRLKLKKETLSRIWMALPPLEEQDEIITHLELLDASLSSLRKHSTVSSLIASGVEILTDVL